MNESTKSSHHAGGGMTGHSDDSPTQNRKSPKLKTIKADERNFDMKLNDFLKPELLGNKFLAVKGYSEVLDRETQKLSAYRLNVSIQDEGSDFFMEMIQVKVNNVAPSLSVQDLKNNKTTPVLLQDLNVGQFNGNLWFSCADVLPANK